MAVVCLKEDHRFSYKYSVGVPAARASEVSQLSIGTSKALPIHLSHILASILDDASDQLAILGSDLLPPSTFTIESVEEQAKKFSGSDPLFDPESGDTYEESFNKKKLLKLHSDSSKITELLTQIKTELRFDREFGCLTKIMNDLNHMKLEQEQLFDDERKNKTAMDIVIQNLQNHEKNSEKHLRVLKEKIGALKDEAEDIMFNNIIRARYIDAWEKARIEQNSLSCFLVENELETTINTNKKEIDKEMRINNEIELFIAENQKDMERAIEDWIEKYDRDEEKQSIEISIYTEKRIALQMEYEALQELYNLHEQQIEDYLLFKENKRLEEERIVFCTVYAIKIQAWWRGLMVRRHLGPFSIKKGKGKKGKDAKNKDKGKKK